MSRSRIDRPCYPVQLRQAIAQFLPTRGLSLTARCGRWSDRLLAIVMLLLVWAGSSTLLERFAEARQATVLMYLSRRRPGATQAGFFKQMLKHSQRLKALLTKALRGHMQRTLADAWYVGRFVAFGFDGSKIDLPRTKANEKALGQAGRKHQGGPQRLVGILIHLGTGLLWSWRQSCIDGSERALLRDMLGELPSESLLVADAGLTGYELLMAILNSGHSFVLRVGANVKLLRKLGYYAKEHRGVVYLWPDHQQKRLQPPLILRLITLSTSRGKTMCLLTNLVSAKDLSIGEAQDLYRKRWGVELVYRALKQTLQRHKLLSDSPLAAEVELDWTLLGLWMLGLMMQEARGKKGESVMVYEGFAHTLRTVHAAISGRGDRRGTWQSQLAAFVPDRYQRTKKSKSIRPYPRKRRQRPPGIPLLRTAKIAEVRLAKRLTLFKQAA